jgi:DUF2075 family protein
MIVYQKTKAAFREDVFSNNVENIIQEQVLQKLGKRTAQPEINSWRNSLQYMDRVLSDSQIPEDSGVGIEYQLPYSGLRIDFVLTGQDEAGTDKAIIIELKQWSEATATDEDGIVATFLGRGIQEVNHPSYQAWSYAAYLEGFNETVYADHIKLLPCAYLHNHPDNGELTSSQYTGYVEKAPLFFKSDAAKLRDFIRQHVQRGDHSGIMYRIEGGRIRPSKQLAEALAGLMKGKPEFILLDEQKVVYETARKLAAKATNETKQVLIVRGGPGTGKTVVAINLLVALTKQALNTKYVSKNSAPRHVYKRKLTGTIRGSRFDSLFVGSGAFIKTPANTFDVLLVDEAHRLNELSGMYGNLGENQVKELITAARCTIFFLDEDQRVAVQDIGSEDEIRHWALQVGAQVHIRELHAQFRCNGSDAYMAWLDNVLAIRVTANPTLEADDYDFRVVDSPDELQQLIYAKNKLNNRARMAAGYCWKWTSKKDAAQMDFQLSPTFRHRWNLATYGNHWIDEPNSVTEIGCIHTTQGLELDYIGVIIGPDLVVRAGEVVTNAMARDQYDTTVKGRKRLLATADGRELLDLVIKNTYRTLLTRAMKGCYVYCTDPETAAYLRRRMTQPA